MCVVSAVIDNYEQWRPDFFNQINELIIEADFEDNNITASIGEEGFPTADEIFRIKGFVSKSIDESRKLRLERIKASFNQNRENKSKC